MAAPVPVPHRGSLPSQEMRVYAHLNLSADNSDRSWAEHLCYPDYIAYEGAPAVQADILATALDDVAFFREAEQARERIGDFVMQSPVLDYDSWQLKDETHQLTRSFKIRGAANFILQRQEEALTRGVIAASAGNHAQGVALVGGKIGAQVRIVVPETVALQKLNAIRDLGAEVLVQGADYQEASDHASFIQQEQGSLLVPAFNHRDVMAGQATIGLELFEQQPAVTDIVVAAGGLGLMAGIARVARVKNTGTRVWGAGLTGANAAAAAFSARRIVKSPIDKLADGIAVESVGSETFPHAYRLGAGILTVSRLALQQEVARLDEREHRAEPAGAVAAAALRQHRERLGSQPVAVLSGANIDPDVLAACHRQAGR